MRFSLAAVVAALTVSALAGNCLNDGQQCISPNDCCPGTVCGDEPSKSVHLLLDKFSYCSSNEHICTLRTQLLVTLTSIEDSAQFYYQTKEAQHRHTLPISAITTSLGAPVSYYIGDQLERGVHANTVYEMTLSVRSRTIVDTARTAGDIND
ncbi:hypothetical protein EDD22DRAFT_850391 [Suillus occidentalis]|nr:hypothetical protein EDD22DRAFT_850391 [Suillus occidentalis]